jgi:hypothetical protein
VAVDDLARVAARKYGSLGRFVSHEVLPPLVERGLFEARKTRVLMIFSTTHYVLTTEGQVARAELEQWLAAGRDRFGEWVGTDTRQALAYAGAAGAALLLMPPLFPELRRLREQTQQVSAGDDGDIATGSASVASLTNSDALLGDGSSIDLGQLDLGNLAADLGGFDFANLSLEVFDALDSAMSAIESAVDSVGGDSGTSSDSSSSNDSGGGGGSDSGGGGGSSDSGGGGSSDSGGGSFS